MKTTTPACFVGLDMGTTNTRAWLVLDGTVVSTARASVGVRDTAMGGSAADVRRTVVQLVRELAPSAPPGNPSRLVIAAGMITSAEGLAEVPHLQAPAGVVELAAAAERHPLPGLDGADLYLVPGIRTGELRLPPEAIGSGDVMRGEETLFLGLAAAGLIAPGEALLSLGSHWKVLWADDEGRVAGSLTSLSGELLHAAQTRTVLAASVPAERPEQVDPEWARLGAREARTSGLERALFCVRLLHLRSDTTPTQRLSYLVGACVASALPHLLHAIRPARSLVVAGGAAVAAVAAEALREEGQEARVLTPSEVQQGMVRGLAAIAAAVVTDRS